MNSIDPFDLARFVRAQESVYEQVVGELESGRKRTHWMWFIFPQFRGLGSSPTSVYYAIQSLKEAEAYLAHPVLGPRLLESASILEELPGADAEAVMGSPDDLKLRSSATLFARVSPASSVFHRVLQKYFGGEEDERTRDLIEGRGN